MHPKPGRGHPKPGRAEGRLDGGGGIPKGVISRLLSPPGTPPGSLDNENPVVGDFTGNKQNGFHDYVDYDFDAKT